MSVVAVWSFPVDAGAQADRCSDTPPGAKNIIDGCAAIDIVRNPERFAEPVDDELASALAFMPANSRSGARTIRRRIARASTLMRRGEVCEASTEYAAMVRSIRDARSSLVRSLPKQRARIERALGKQPRVDVSEGELEALALGLGPAALERAIGRASEGLPAFRGPCRRLRREFNTVGPLGYLDDGRGVLRRGSRTLALGAGLRGRLFGGGHGRLHGVQFDDGTSVITRADVQNGISNRKRVTVPRRTQRCIEPRIVPIVRPRGGTAPRHDVRGYESGGVLHLESRTRLAAEQICPDEISANGQEATRYALRVSLSYTPLKGAKTVTTVLAPELEDGDTAVGLPPYVSAVYSAKLIVTQVVKRCVGHRVLEIDQLGRKVFSEKAVCAMDVRGTHVRSHQLKVRPAGSYASASYESLLFDLDTRPANTCRFGRVLGHGIDDPSLANAQDMRFVAEAWRADEGPCSADRPALETIGPGDPFRVYLDDPVPASLTASDRLEQYGVRELSGLTWPRVEGTRGGYPFTYSAKTPRLVRDLVNVCGGGFDRYGAPFPNTFHRAPFDPGNTTWGVRQGNEDDPGNYMADGVTPIFSDFDGDGVTDEPYHNAGQRYEWDIVNDSNGDGRSELDHPLRASRAGRIVLIDRNEKGNGNGLNEVVGHPTASSTELQQDPDDPPLTNYVGSGNYIWIAHADGTYATYNHLRYNSIPAGLKLGSWVRRGEVIAKVGNTGSSSAPHLHWGAFTATSIDVKNARANNIVKVPLRVQDKAHPNGCWVPRQGEGFDSNNERIEVPPFF